MDQTRIAISIIVAAASPSCSVDNADTNMDGGIVDAAVSGDGHRSDAPSTPDASVVASMVGASGGMVTHPGGVTLEIPEGALDSPTEIKITEALAGYETPLPAETAGAVFAFEPHGQIFSEPITVTFDYSLEQGHPTVYWAEQGSSWQQVFDSTYDSTTVSVETTHFSHGFPAGAELCNYMSQSGCSGSEKCAYHYSDQHIECVPNGNKNEGESCTNDGSFDSCAAGLHCYSGLCRKFCDLGPPATGCSGEESCVAFPDALDGTSTAGICMVCGVPDAGC